VRKVHEITAEEEGFRLEPINGPFEQRIMGIRRDPVEPEPVGTVLAEIWRITGYDRDCDGSLMARRERIDRNGNTTGSERVATGLYSDCDVVLDHPGELHDTIDRIACPFGGFCIEEEDGGHPCDRDQFGDRIEGCTKNLDRGVDRYVQIGDILSWLERDEGRIEMADRLRHHLGLPTWDDLDV
jgi:hypothetical protein